MKKLFIFISQVLKRPYLLLRKNDVPLTTRVYGNAKLFNSKIGINCYISSGTVINDAKIGNYCSIAPNVIIGGMEHSYWYPSTSTHLSDECISGRVTIIGNDVWIGANSIIRQGITIGDGAVIGAGSVVTKNVTENTIVCGNPAKLLKKRFADDIWERIKNARYWEHEKQKAKEDISTINFK